MAQGTSLPNLDEMSIDELYNFILNSQDLIRYAGHRAQSLKATAADDDKRASHHNIVAEGIYVRLPDYFQFRK